MIDSVGAIAESGIDSTGQLISSGQSISSGLNDAGSMIATPQIGASSVFDAQIWMGRSPWQPAAGWSVVAALLTLVPLTRWFGAGSNVDWRLVALLLLLVDPLWGSIWRFSAGRATVLPLRTDMLRRRFWLPYLSPDSPAARLMGHDLLAGDSAQSVYPVLFRVTLPSVVLAAAVAAVLGISALWMTGLVVLLSILAWVDYSNLREDQQRPNGFGQYWQRSSLLRALITVGLPWGALLLQMRETRLSDSMMGSTALNPEVASVSWILLFLWVLHSWGEGCCLRWSRDRLGIGLLALSDLGMALLLIVIGVPIGLGILSVIWLATWFSVYNGLPLQRVQGWWLLAMLISAASVGFAGQF